ncbi:MAG: prenyltransferase/squalene oxidase repeat-containing protein [Planctomycetota bacterium]
MLRFSTVLAASLLALPALADDPAPALKHRVGDRTDRVKAGGGDDDTEAAVKAGLLWLARHQANDGSWRASKFSAECLDADCTGEGLDEFDTGETGLALLAFVGAGIGPDFAETWNDPSTNRNVKPGEVVKRGAVWLEKKQNQDGSFGPRNVSKVMYNHAVATAAMCELYGLTKDAGWKASAIAGVDFLLAARNPEGAWRYSPKCGDNDTSVTSWCVHALHAAVAGGLEVDEEGVKGALAWVKRVTDQEYGRVGYTAKGTGKVIIMGKNEDWEHHETLTAAGMLARLYAGAKPGSRTLDNAAKLLVCDLPIKEVPAKVDSYYWYYGTQALWECHGPETKYWKAWNKTMKTAVAGSQKSGKGCDAGSWDPAVDRWGCDGGRIFSTVMGVLTLEVYYRWPEGGHGEEEK